MKEWICESSIVSGTSEGIFAGWIIEFATTILTLKNPVGSEESAERVSETLISHRCTLSRGHGVFARGNNLEVA